MTTITMTVNGKSASGNVEGRTLLVDFLRNDLNLTGTHVGCDTSQCGACTVHVDGKAVKSCTIFAVDADGADVQTIEGQANEDGSLNVIQQAFQDHHGLQCGFCTPGLICSLSVAITRDDMSSDQELDAVIDGHLCRCTGYVNIRRAAKKAAKNFQGDFYG